MDSPYAPRLRHKLVPRRRRDGSCDDDFSYYDDAISSCTPCNHLCEDHQIQGTTEQCMQKCYKYYIRMEHGGTTRQSTIPTTSGDYSSTENIPSRNTGMMEGDKGTAILIVVAVILVVACVGLTVFIAWKIWKRCRPNPDHNGQDVKRSVPCSEEDGLNNLAESQKRLLPSTGPICQPEENPPQGINQGQGPTGAQPHSWQRSDPLQRTFAELGFQCSVLDQPLVSTMTHSTIPKDTYTDTDSASDIDPTSTRPKVFYTSDSGTGDMHSGTGTGTGTIAEYSNDSQMYIS